MQIADELEAGVTQGIIRSIRTKSAFSGVLCAKKKLPLWLLYCRIQWGIFSQDSLFFIPKYGLRRKENFCLSSANLMWMPGQNHMLLIVILQNFFFIHETHIPKAVGSGKESQDSERL